MKKNILIIVALIIIGAVGYQVFRQETQKAPDQTNNGGNGENEITFDPKNATYIIEGESYTLVNGKSEVDAAPGSAIKITTMFWSEPFLGDLDGDGTEDGAMIITQNQGGSGTFFYVVAALQNPQTKKAQGTNAILLGDRIAPQNISINSKLILVNYADRKPGEPFSVQPSVGVSRWFVFVQGELKEMHICSAQEKIAQVCTKEYNPVCGDDLETYGNGCEACKSNKANSWISGECKL